MRLLSLAAAAVVAASLPAATVIVNPGDPTWNEIGASGGGNTAITGDQPRSGLGSVRTQGDRTRWTFGNPFTNGPQTDLGLLSNLTAFSGEYFIPASSTNPLDPDLTPAFRLHIIDGTQRSELIWEGAYNNVYGNPPTNARDTWHSITFHTANLWQFQTGFGPTFDTNNAQLFQSAAAWAACTGGPYQGGAPCYTANARIAAISFGLGSGFTTGYVAYGDNIRLAVGGANPSDNTYNFETVIPEPSTYALIGAGLASIAWLRRRAAH